jgi:hypothetical protein
VISRLPSLRFDWSIRHSRKFVNATERAWCYVRVFTISPAGVSMNDTRSGQDDSMFATRTDHS